MTNFLNNNKIILAVLGLFFVLLKPVYANEHAKAVADELNLLYQRTTACENDEPAYFCSGIIIHGQRVPDKYNSLSPWYLPAYRNVGSFSYLRSDITPRSGEAVYINTGFILTPMDEVAAKKQYQYTVYCEFPGDGATVGDLDNSCHFKPKFEGQTVCGDEVSTIDDYAKKFLNANPQPWDSATSHCSFLSKKDRFDLSMQIYKYLFMDHPKKTVCKDNAFCRVHNELVIGTWEMSKVADREVPILAFFAIINDATNPMFRESGRTSTSKEELEQLFKDADAYSKATHYARNIPVVTLDMSKLRRGEKDIFAPAIRQ